MLSKKCASQFVEDLSQMRNRIRDRYRAKRGVQIRGMIFQTRSGIIKFDFALYLALLLSISAFIIVTASFPVISDIISFGSASPKKTSCGLPVSSATPLKT